MKNIILNISDGDKHFESAIKEYLKRLWNTVVVENVKPSKNWTPKQIIQKDTEKIIEILEKKYSESFKVLLTKDWEKIDTMDMCKIWKWYNVNVFIIWGPYWFDEEILTKKVNKCISFGNITMPHWLAKLVLLEQIFRVDCIEKNKSYHY